MEKTDTKKEYTIDAKGKVLGRLASEIALILQGKRRVDYMPNKDFQDFVIIQNIEKLKVTGKKMEDKIYFSHSGYLGGDKYTPMKVIFDKKPGDILVKAVSGMLPKNRLRARRIKRIKFE